MQYRDIVSSNVCITFHSETRTMDLGAAVDRKRSSDPRNGSKFGQLGDCVTNPESVQAGMTTTMMLRKSMLACAEEAVLALPMRYI